LRWTSRAFAPNDHLAIGAMRPLSELGRPVHEGVSVVGSDIPEAACVDRTMATMNRLEAAQAGHHKFG
jgi:DNA-binding LacI/PurR family transcriptional regulator